MELNTTEYNNNRRLYEVIPPLSAVTSNNGETALKNILGDNQFGFTAEFNVDNNSIDYLRLIYQSPNEWEPTAGNQHWGFVSNHGKAFYRDLQVQDRIDTYVIDAEAVGETRLITDVEYIVKYADELTYIVRADNDDFGQYVTRGNISYWLKEMLFITVDSVTKVPDAPDNTMSFLKDASEDSLAQYFRNTVIALADWRIEAQEASTIESVLPITTFNSFIGDNITNTSYHSINTIFTNKLEDYYVMPTKTTTRSFLEYEALGVGEDITNKVGPTAIGNNIIKIEGTTVYTSTFESVDITATTKLTTDLIKVTDYLTIEDNDGYTAFINPTASTITLGRDDGDGGTTDDWMVLAADLSFPKTTTVAFVDGGETSINNILKYGSSVDTTANMTQYGSFPDTAFMPKRLIETYIGDIILTIAGAASAGDLLKYNGTKELAVVDGLTHTDAAAWDFTNGITITETSRPDWATLENADVVTKEEINTQLVGKVDVNPDILIAGGEWAFTGGASSGGVFYINNDGGTPLVTYTNDINIAPSGIVNVTYLTTEAKAALISVGATSVINAGDVALIAESYAATKADITTVNSKVSGYDTSDPADLLFPSEKPIVFADSDFAYSSYAGISLNMPKPERTAEFIATEGGLDTAFSITADKTGIMYDSIIAYINNPWNTGLANSIDAAIELDIMTNAIPAIITGFNEGSNKIEPAIADADMITTPHKVNLYQLRHMLPDGAVDERYQGIFSPMSYSYDEAYYTKAEENTASPNRARFEDIFAATISNFEMYGDNDLLPKSAIKEMIHIWMQEFSGFGLIPRSPLEEDEMINNAALTAQFTTSAPVFKTPSNDPAAIPADPDSSVQVAELEAAAIYAATTAQAEVAAKAIYDADTTNTDNYNKWQDAIAEAQTAADALSIIIKSSNDE
jgi:hypothetical protein